MPSELMLGSFGLSVILSILLRMLFSTWQQLENRAKPWIAAGLGVALSIVVMLATCSSCTLLVVINYVTQGFMTGSAAVGYYEMTQKAK